MCRPAAEATQRKARTLTVDPKDIRNHVLKYAKTDDRKAWTTVVLTLALYLATLLLLVYPIVDWRIIVVVRGLVFVRMFVVFHDCCHGSLFKSSHTNFYVGKIAGACLFTPFERWRRDHVHHHRVYGIDDVYDSALTVRWTEKEWQTFPTWKKAIFRVARDPFIFLWFPPLCKFFIQYRFIGGGGATFTNIFKGSEWLMLYSLLGSDKMAVEALACLFAAGFGVALFHLQHHYNPAYREEEHDHSADEAAILGSSWLMLPWFLRWATLGIEYHHVHHFNSRVPCYSLQDCHESAPPGMWNDVTFISPKLAIRSLFHVHYNTEKRKYESFPLYEPVLEWLFPGC